MAESAGKPLVIIGNSEIAAMACEYFRHDSPYEPVGFAIGAEYIESDSFEGLPVVSLDAVTKRFPPDQVSAFVAIGGVQLNRVPARHYDLMKQKGFALASYVSSHAFRWHNVEIGDNCLSWKTIRCSRSLGSAATSCSGAATISVIAA